jgi:hypothetical protein
VSPVRPRHGSGVKCTSQVWQQHPSPTAFPVASTHRTATRLPQEARRPGVPRPFAQGTVPEQRPPVQCVNSTPSRYSAIAFPFASTHRTADTRLVGAFSPSTRAHVTREGVYLGHQSMADMDEQASGRPGSWIAGSRARGYGARLRSSATELGYRARLQSSTTELGYRAQLQSSATELGYRARRKSSEEELRGRARRKSSEEVTVCYLDKTVCYLDELLWTLHLFLSVRDAFICSSPGARFLYLDA